MGKTTQPQLPLHVANDADVPYDSDRLAAVLERLERSSPGWHATNSGKSGMASPLGHDEESGTDWYIEAVEYNGNAKADAEFLGHAQEDIRYLLRLVAQMRVHVWSKPWRSQ